MHVEGSLVEWVGRDLTRKGPSVASRVGRYGAALRTVGKSQRLT